MRLAIGQKTGDDDQRQSLVAAAVVGKMGLFTGILKGVLKPPGLDPRLARGFYRRHAKRPRKENPLALHGLFGGR